MFFGDSLSIALEDVWQLALTFASLKYIAGTISSYTQKQEDSQGDEETDEVLSDFTREEVSQDNTEMKENTEDEMITATSMASHKIYSKDCSETFDLPDSCISLRSHMVQVWENIEKDETALPSSLTHRISTIEKSLDEHKQDDPGPYLECFSEYIDFEDECEDMVMSFVAHELSKTASDEYSNENLTSMSSHFKIPDHQEHLEQSPCATLVSHIIANDPEFKRSEIIYPMNEFVHQTVKYPSQEFTTDSGLIDLTEEKCCLENEQQNANEHSLEESKQSEFANSLSSHMLVNSDCPAFFLENIVSLSSHVHIRHDVVDEDTRHLASMVAHQQLVIEVSFPPEDDIDYDYDYTFLTIHEDVPSYDLSSVAHRLPSMDIDVCCKEPFTSRISHEVSKVEVEDEDSFSLPSMRAHQLNHLDGNINIYNVKGNKESYFQKEEELQEVKFSEQTPEADVSLCIAEEESDIGLINLCISVSEMMTKDVFADIPTSSVSHIVVNAFEDQEFPDSYPSMTSHSITELSEANPSLSATSMACHMTTDVAQETDDAPLVIPEEIYETLMHMIFEDDASSSFCTHQLQCPDSPAEYTDFITSNVAHYGTLSGSENADSFSFTSMLGHQSLDILSNTIPDDYICCPASSFEEKTLDLVLKDNDDHPLPQEKCEETESEIISAVAHEIIETMQSELDISLAAHTIVNIVEEDFRTFPSCLCHETESFVSNKASDTLVHGDALDIYEYLKETEREELFHASSVSHQLPAEDEHTFVDEESITSNTAHYHLVTENSDIDTLSLSSMTAHHLNSSTYESGVESCAEKSVEEFIEAHNLSTEEKFGIKLPHSEGSFSAQDDEMNALDIRLSDDMRKYKSEKMDKINNFVQEGHVYSSMTVHALPVLDASFLYNRDHLYSSMTCHMMSPVEFEDCVLADQSETHLEATIQKEEADPSEIMKENNEESNISELLKTETLDDPRKKEPGETTSLSSNISCDVDEDNCTDQNINESSHFEEDNYRNRIKRIEGLRKIVEDELGEFEKKKNTEHETNISIINVKDIEFPVMINLHHSDDIEITSVVEEDINLQTIEEEINLQTIEEEIDLQNIKEENSQILVPLELEVIQTNEIYFTRIDNEEENLVSVPLKEASKDRESTSIRLPFSIEDVNIEEFKGISMEKVEMNNIEIQSLNADPLKVYDKYNEENIINENNNIDRRESENEDAKYIEYDDIHTNEPEEVSEENMVRASCTLGENQPIVIKTCAFHSSDENVYECVKNRTDDEKLGNIVNVDDLPALETITSQVVSHVDRTVNKDIKKRDQELLHSFMNTNKEKKSSSIQDESEESGKGKCTLEKAQPTSKVSLPIKVGGKVKKETYKIRFKVDIGAGSHSKHSVLHYLFGCFGGQKMFNSSHI